VLRNYSITTIKKKKKHDYNYWTKYHRKYYSTTTIKKEI